MMRLKSKTTKRMKHALLILILFWAFNSEVEGGTPAPRRIISLAPNITEIVFRLGAGKRLVGRTDFDLYPKAAQKIPSVGGYLNPDYEKIVALKPDLILMLPNAALAARFKDLGIATIDFPDETIEEILSSISRLGELLNLEQPARRVVAGIEDTLRYVRDRAKKFPPLPAGLFVGRNPGSLKGMYAAGTKTYLSELWVISGGRNSFADVSRRYFNISKEDLIRRDPAAILEFRVLDSDSAEQRLAKLRHDWDALSTLSAVRTGRIKIFPERYFLIPGPRISRMAIELSNLIADYTGAGQ